MNLWDVAPKDFIEVLRANNLRRAYLVTEPQTSQIISSHPVLESIAQAMKQDRRDFHGHEGCFFEIGQKSGHLLSAFVHLTRRGQAAGGVRFWSYTSMEAFIRDGLRLSRGMGHKCALAGLWWGGGKGVIARQDDVDHRDPGLRAAVYSDYGRFISSLCGCYITAEDVGTTPDDMATIFSQTRHTTCVPKEYGGSGNPSILTARGVVVAMEAALDFIGAGSLEGKTIALQGLGNVSTYMVEELLRRRVKKIIGADIDERTVNSLRQKYPGAPLELRCVGGDDLSILAEPVDVLAPNAVGAMLNSRTIERIKARVVCGGANNQLEDPSRDALALKQRKILYVPDFLANRMGIVNCANEQYGCFENDPAITAHLERATPHGIFSRCQEVLRRAAASGKTTAEEAVMLADDLANIEHPIWGHRGRQIIQYLVDSKWANG